MKKVVDGSRVELAAELVQASEPLQIRWTRNKVTIADSPSFSYSRSEKMVGSRTSRLLNLLTLQVFLTIADVFPEDGGEYTVEAKNQFGIARCTMLLDVRSKFSYPFSNHLLICFQATNDRSLTKRHECSTTSRRPERIREPAWSCAPKSSDTRTLLSPGLKPDRSSATKNDTWYVPLGF